MNENMNTRCGYVAIIGRPNVGKSTLLNRFIGEKISITSRKPQTTRQKILGIKTYNQTQIVFVDTPGLHKTGAGKQNALNRYMNKTATSVMKDVELILFVVEGTHWQEEDEWIFNRIKNAKCPVILVINKSDNVIPKEILLPHIEKLSQRFTFANIVPVSAHKGTNLDKLEAEITQLLPESPFFYFPEQITDQPQQLRIAEIIREKLIKSLGQELPYATSVVVEQLKQENEILHINATIFVEREGQKIIILGKNGVKMKQIATSARLDLEKVLQQKVFLQIWVKIKKRWTDDEKALKILGYSQ